MLRFWLINERVFLIYYRGGGIWKSGKGMLEELPQISRITQIGFIEEEENWRIGELENWSIRALEHWRIGALEHWSIGTGRSVEGTDRHAE
jgi:hypothetical protein